MTERLTSDIHALSGAYALDAVDDVERVAVERHLRECDPCAQEVAEFKETVTRLADSVAVVPPQAMRSAVLETISRTPQLRPGRPDRAPSTGTSSRRWRRVAAGSVAAGIVAVAVGIGTWTVADQRVDRARTDAATARARAAAIEQIVAAPDARVRVTPAKGGGTVSVVSSSAQDRAVAVLAGLEVPPDGQGYQLWRIPDGDNLAGAEPLTFVPPGQGTATVLIPDIDRAELIGVTREPARAEHPDTNEIEAALAP